MSESPPASGSKIDPLLKGDPDTDRANTNASRPRTNDSRDDSKCTGNQRTIRATSTKNKGRCTFMSTCVMVSYYVILLTAIGAKLIPQSYLIDMYDSPAKVTLVLDHLVTYKLHETPSIGTVTSKIYLHGHYHTTHSYKTLLLCIIVPSGDSELNPIRPYSRCQSLKPSLVFLNRASHGRRRNNDVTSQDDIHGRCAVMK